MSRFHSKGEAVFFLAAAAILAGAMSGVGKAAVVLGSLGNNGSVPVGGGSFSTDTYLAVGFTTGTSPLLLELSSATFGLSVDSGTASVAAAVYSNASGKPGSPLSGGEMGSQTVGTSPTTATFTASSPIALAASTAYWIVLNSSAVLNWHDPFDAIQAENSSGWGSLGGQQSANGTGWIQTDEGSVGAVSITAVPEPGSLVLLASAAIAACGNFLRRRPNVAIVN